MKHVFITGASGVLGSVLTPMFLAEPATKVYLLLRAESPAMLAVKLKALLARWCVKPDGREAFQRVEAVAGDIRQPRLGLAPVVYERISGAVTQIVHAAGDVKLGLPLDEARRANSAAEILEFAADCHRRGQLQKFDHVSTIGVAGAASGVVEERPYAESRRFHNTYEVAKAEAESAVLTAMSNGLPGTVHRPSMIVGNSESGEVKKFQGFYHLVDFLAGVKTCGVVPEMLDLTLDTIPVDYVARAIFLASNSPETAGRIWHLCSGPERSWELKKFSDFARRELSMRGVPMPPLRELRLAEARETFRQLKPGDQGPFLRVLPFILDYFDERRDFENKKTNDYLSAASLSIPAVDRYLEKVMQPYWDATLN